MALVMPNPPVQFPEGAIENLAHALFADASFSSNLLEGHLFRLWPDAEPISHDGLLPRRERDLEELVDVFAFHSLVLRRWNQQLLARHF